MSSGRRDRCTPTSASSWPADASDRLLDPALGAGALLDMGIYPLTFARMMLGPFADVTAAGTLSDSGIDLDVAIAAPARRAARSPRSPPR